MAQRNADLEARAASAHRAYICMECGFDVRHKDAEGNAALSPPSFAIRPSPAVFDGLGFPVTVRVHETCADSSLFDYMRLAEQGRTRADTRAAIEALR